MARLVQSTTRVRVFLLTLSSDHLTGATGKTPTVNISKAGGAFAAAAGAVAEIGSGWYKITLTTGDTGTLGDLAFHITASGCDDTDFADEVQVWNPYQAGIPVSAGGIASTAFAAGAITASALATDALSSAAVSAAAAQKVADALLDRTDAVEAGVTPRGSLRAMLAALAGKVTGAATATVTMRNAVADSKNRLVASVDADGNRSAIVYDLT